MSTLTIDEIRDRSLAWIQSNPSASNLQVPQDLRELWLSIHSGDPDSPEADLLVVIFTHGLMQQQLLTNKWMRKKKMQISLKEIMHQFDLWILKLSLAEISAKTEQKSNPLPLWRFSKNEKVTFTPTDDPVDTRQL